jgi:hypothetical protein
MIKLVRPSGKIRTIGETSEVFKSKLQSVEIGDDAEITDSEGNTLNIARVTDITNESGTDTIHIVMIA